jgi:hypothetical protein
MKNFFSIILLFCLTLSTFDVFASSRVQEAISSDRESRLEEINRLVLKINQAETDLANFRYELSRVQANSTKLDKSIFMRDAAGVVAALGFCATMIYHKSHVTPSMVMLVGGYTLSTISAVVMAIEHKGVRLSQKEINDLKMSIVKLENSIAIEKINLQKEIDLLESLYY